MHQVYSPSTSSPPTRKWLGDGNGLCGLVGHDLENKAVLPCVWLTERRCAAGCAVAITVLILAGHTRSPTCRIQTLQTKHDHDNVKCGQRTYNRESLRVTL